MLYLAFLCWHKITVSDCHFGKIHVLGWGNFEENAHYLEKLSMKIIVNMYLSMFEEEYYDFFSYGELWQYEVWSFQTGYTKLERFLHKNQHAQRKWLNFENWTNEEPQYLAKIRVFKVDYFILPSFLVPKLKSVTQKEWKKHPYIIFLLLVKK